MYDVMQTLFLLLFNDNATAAETLNKSIKLTQNSVWKGKYFYFNRDGDQCPFSTNMLTVNSVVNAA